ncbi:winged helix-turn-helix transcriptional regulator [Subtercola lobariae]|nr:helix-turn-helix domain-containing protein [Subtercola lobariae]
MKSYGQLCSAARALDIVGDRWNLLIVRELLIRRQIRFTDLQAGLPGIAPNLLVSRLRELEENGVVRRDTAVAPATGLLYALTERGRELDGVVRELVKWGAPTIVDAPPDATFQMHWLSLPARFLLKDSRPDDAPITIRFGDPRDGFDLVVANGTTAVEPCRLDATPGATVTGPGLSLVGLLQGAIPLAGAAAYGITVDGAPDALPRVLPSSR